MPKIVRLIEDLKRFSLFEGMGIREFHAIASITQREQYRDGDVIFRPGEEDLPLILLVGGRMEIHHSYETPEDRSATIGPGSFLGEVSIFSRNPTIATCIARDRAEALIISRFQLQEVMRIYPQIGINLCRFFARKVDRILRHRPETAEIRT